MKGGFIMPSVKVYRYPDNPILRPADVLPHREDYEVIGVFNAGVAEVAGEVLLVLRVAERPRASRSDVVAVLFWHAQERKLTAHISRP